MKKTILILLAMFLSIGMFTSCEEEEEPAQTLTAFVIGEWYSDVVDLGDVDTDIYFLLVITADHYLLSMTDGTNTIDLPQANYVVDNDANTITIDQPQFPDDEPTDEHVPFKVTWVEGGTTMTWTPIEGSDAPTLQWTRGD